MGEELLDRPWSRLVLKPGLYLLAGIAIGHAAGWNLLDSTFFAVVTSTTVGYGDFTVMGSEATANSDSIKLVSMLYMLAGLVIIGHLISEIATQVVSNSLEKFNSPQEYDLYLVQTEAERLRTYTSRAIKAHCAVVAIILSGAFFMLWNEQHTLVDALYWSVQTVTTVGYGDVPMKHESTRFFCCLFIPVSVTIVTGVITELTNIQLDKLQDERRAKLLALEMTDDLAEEIDDHVIDGVISEAEFVRYMLVQEGLVSFHDFDRYLNHFRNDFDVNNNGKLYYKNKFKVGSRVRIAKKGSQEGNTAVVTNSNWNGMVKVEMDGTHTAKSYHREELIVVTTVASNSSQAKMPAPAAVEPILETQGTIHSTGDFQTGSML
jgi:hypothetical protein